MNDTEKVAEWVEYKIGQLLSDDIEKRIDSESLSFDVERYSQELFEEHFLGEVEENVKEMDFHDLNLKLNLDMDDFYLTVDSSEEEQYDYCLASLDSIIQDLQDPSEAIQIRALESLEACSAEELVIQNSWTLARKILQDKFKTNESENVSSHILELFRRFLLLNDTPRVVCEGFVSLAESIIFHIETIRLRKRQDQVKESYDFRTNKWMRNSVSEGIDTEISSTDIWVIVKAMWLLVNSQKGIPAKWNRFNEKRLREIVFSFVHMLSSTKNLKNNGYICGLEILSVLDPRAVWISNWCHGAIGRSLLCSALKTHKKLFDEIVDFVMVKVRTKGVRPGEKNSNIGVKLPPLVENDLAVPMGPVCESENMRNKNLHSKDQKFSARMSMKENGMSKGNRSAPTLKSDENLYEMRSKKEKHYSDWIINDIPKEVVDEAKFCHCLSMVVFLIQYKGGRSLFPLEVTCRRRRITVADFVSTALNYINRLLFFSERNPSTTDVYREHMMKMLHILKSM